MVCGFWGTVPAGWFFFFFLARLAKIKIPPSVAFRKFQTLDLVSAASTSQKHTPGTISVNNPSTPKYHQSANPPIRSLLPRLTVNLQRFIISRTYSLPLLRGEKISLKSDYLIQSVFKIENFSQNRLYSLPPPTVHRSKKSQWKQI